MTNDPETTDRIKVGFDIDGTLVDENDRPIWETINILLWFVNTNADVICWSGGGPSYTETWVRRLGLDDKVRVVPKGSERVDVAFDDQPVKLGTVNFLVSR